MTAPEILSLRTRLRMSQARFAAACDLGKGGDRIVRYWESGRKRPGLRSLRELKRLARKVEREPEMAEWKVGQKVAKVPHYRAHGIRGPHTIAVVKGRKVVLDDGSEWATSGREWGTGRDVWSARQYIATWDEERHPAMMADHARARQAIAITDEIRNFRDRLTLEQIAAIRAVLAEG